MAKISTYTNNGGSFNTGDLFITANPVSNANNVTYSKDMFSGLVASASPNSYGLNLDDLSNDLFLRTQMGAAGMLGHANISALNNFKNKLNGTGLLNVIYGGDGFTIYNPAPSISNGSMGYVWGQLINNYGTGGFGGAAYPYIYGQPNAGATYVSNLVENRDTYLQTNHIKIVAPLGTASYSPDSTANKFLSDTIIVSYVSDTGAGNFKFLTGLYPGSLAVHSGVNASGAILNTRSLSIKMNAPNYYQCQISGSGDVSLLRIPSVIFKNSTANSGRMVLHTYNRDQGPSYSNAITDVPGSIRTNIRDEVWSGINPDLLIWSLSSTMTTSEQSGMSSFLNGVRTKWPTCSIFIAGIHPTFDTVTRDANLIQKSIAIKYGCTYFDTYGAFVGPENFSGRGFTSPTDYPHPTTSGNIAYGKLVWNYMNL